MFEFSFRPDAPGEPASPDRLDEAIEAASTMFWLVVAVLSFVVAAAMVWSVYGTVTTRVSGDGLLTYEGAQLVDVVSRSEGYLAELPVGRGDRVSRGDVVARLETTVGADAGPENAIEIRAATDGEIVAVLAGAGELLRPGDRVYQMTNRLSGLLASAFFAADRAELIEPGMAAQIELHTISQQEFGNVRGVVREVSRFRLSAEALQAQLGNEQLVERFSRSGPPLGVEIDLVPGPGGGYEWTTGRAPSFEVQAGMMATVSIVVRRRRPISLVFPALADLPGTE